jgi:predicted amidohydrolase YtcJ
MQPARNSPASRNTRGRAAPPAPVETLNHAVALVDKRGWQVLVRPADDHGLRAALDAFDAALQANPVPPRGRRHRIEDLTAGDIAEITRLETLGLVAAVQPLVDRTDTVASITPPVVAGDPETVSSGAIARRIVDGGGNLAFGSDWPASSLDPLIGIKSTVNDQPGDTANDEPVESDGSLSIARAIDAYTATAAWASFDEERKGTLAPGMLADIVILSTDVLALSPERLLDASVIVTIFDGKVVYTREPPASD